MIYDQDTFEHNGRSYRVTLEVDQDMREPWKEHDGHGIVSDHKYHAQGMGSKPSKAPGERILYWERGYFRTYDVQATMKIARRDGWGLGREDEARLVQALGREPTRGEIVAAAVDQDFEHLRGWCNDEWHWTCVGVHHESGESEYLGGVESSDDDYLMECARDLADEIAHRLDTAMACEITASRPDMYATSKTEG